MAANSSTAKLIMQLVDRVSGPAKAVVGSLNTVKSATMGLSSVAMAPARAVTAMGRHIRRTSTDVAGLSAVTAIGVGAATKAVYDYEKAGNKMQAFGLLTDQQREALEERAQALNKDFPFTNKDIIRAAQELFRAGLTYEQAMGALRGSLNLALAGDLDIKEATDIATNIMTAMKLPMDTYDQVQASLLKVNDALAYAATNSNTDVRLMGDTFRYVAPLATAAGMQLEEVTAISMELARAGIKGSEAGVALRSALVRMAKPTKPMLAAFERLNISMADFVKYRDDLKSESIINSLLPSGIDVGGLAGEIQTILDDTTLKGAPARMGAALTDLIVKSMGDETLRNEVSSVVNDAVLAGAQDVDLLGLLRVLREKGATITDISQIFDVRMGSRLAAILSSDLDAAVSEVRQKYQGVGAEMAEQMMKGVVGSVARIVAAFENFVIKIAESGVLDTISNAMDKVSEFVTTLSKTNPKLLEFGTYTVLALAAVGPLAIAIGGLVSVAGLLINPLSWAAAGLGALAYFKWDGIKAGFNALNFGLRTTLSPQNLERLDSMPGKLKALWKWLSSPPDTKWWTEWGRKVGIAVGEGVNFLSDLPGRFSAFVGDMQEAAGKGLEWWEELKTSTSAIFDGIADGGRRAAKAFADFENAGQRVIEKAGFAAAAFASDVYQNGGTWIAQAIADMHSFGVELDVWIAEKAASFINAITSRVGQAFSAGDQLMGSLWEGMKAKFDEVAAWATGVASRVEQAVRSGVGDLFSAGSQMLQDLWEGMKAKAHELLSWASGIGSRIKSALSFGSWGGGEASASPAPAPAAPSAPPKKAAGGAVRRGLTYEINERGRETVTMGTNGYVTPAHKVGGGGGMTNIFYIQGRDGDDIARKMINALEHQLARADQLSLDGRPIR